MSVLAFVRARRFLRAPVPGFLLLAVLLLAGCNAGESYSGVGTSGDGSGSGSGGGSGSGSGTGGGTGTGTGTGSGTGTGTGGGIRYTGPKAVTAPSRYVAERVLCGSGLAATEQADETMRERAAVLGLTHVHSQSPDAWLAGPEAAMRTGGVAAGSLDGDCWPDLAFTGPAGDGVLLYTNQGQSGFLRSATLSLEEPATGVALADINGDALADVLVGNLLPGELRIFGARAKGGYADIGRYPMAAPSYGMAVTDLALDGWLDVYIAHWDAVSVAGAPALLGADVDGILYDADDVGGLGAGTIDRQFQFAPAFAPLRAGDYPELLVAADRGQTDLYAVVGDRYESIVDRGVITAENGHGAVVADFNGDGLWDWFVAGVEGPADARPWDWGTTGNRLYLGTGGGAFLDATDAAGLRNSGWSWGACAADFNNDGATDLFVTGGFGTIPAAIAALLDPADVDYFADRLAGYETQLPRLFLNDGDGVFTDVSSRWGLTVPVNGRGVACLDRDRDGDIDVAVAQNEAVPLFYDNLNGAGAGRRFLKVSLQGDLNNHDAIGAVVEVVAGGRQQLRQAAVNSNYLGQDARELHFGLGSAAAVERLEVRWPDGKTTVLEDVAVDRHIEIADPDLNPVLSRKPSVDKAIADAIAYLATLEGSEERADVFVVMELLASRYGVDFGFGPLAELDAVIARLEAGDAEDRLAARIYALYRRWVDPLQAPTWPLEDLFGIDALTVPALYCRSEPFPAGYQGRLRAAAGLGGYQATHALLALSLLHDQGCATGLGDGDVATIIAGNAAVFDLSDRVLDDVDIEVLLFMSLTGDGHLIREEWLDLLLEARQEGGGWVDSLPLDGGRPARGAEGHPTVLALWLLLELRQGHVGAGAPLVAR